MHSFALFWEPLLCDTIQFTNDEHLPDHISKLFIAARVEKDLLIFFRCKQIEKPHVSKLVVPKIWKS